MRLVDVDDAPVSKDLPRRRLAGVCSGCSLCAAPRRKPRARLRSLRAAPTPGRPPKKKRKCAWAWAEKTSSLKRQARRTTRLPCSFRVLARRFLHGIRLGLGRAARASFHGKLLLLPSSPGCSGQPWQLGLHTGRIAQWPWRSCQRCPSSSLSRCHKALTESRGTLQKKALASATGSLHPATSWPLTASAAATKLGKHRRTARFWRKIHRTVMPYIAAVAQVRDKRTTENWNVDCYCCCCCCHCRRGYWHPSACSTPSVVSARNSDRVLVVGECKEVDVQEIAGPRRSFWFSAGQRASSGRSNAHQALVSGRGLGLADEATVAEDAVASGERMSLRELSEKCLEVLAGLPEN